MKHITRITAWLLVLLSTSSIICACSGGDSAVSDNTSAADTTPMTEAVTDDTGDRTTIKDNLPDDLDYEGRSFGIYVYEESAKYTLGDAEMAGDIVNDAVIARNIAVEERLNITLNAVSQNNSSLSTVRSLLMSGDTVYDLFIGYQYEFAQLIANGGLYNLYDLEHLDFSQPWWWEDYMQELQLGDNSRYFAVGDYFIRALMYAHTVYYNKALYQEYADDADGLYDMVLDGTWTFEEMAKISKNSYLDLNNNGKTDADDRLGYVVYTTKATVDPFVYGSDIPFSRRVDGGNVELTMMQEDAVTLTERLNEFFWQPGSLTQVENGTAATEIFAAGRAMFWCSFLSGAKYLRDMEEDFGIIPYPKFDAEQKEYRSLVHDGAALGGVNGCSLNLDMTGAILEALCAETYRSVTPVWYETSMKIKYSRDDVSSQMIDLIHDTATTNFLFAYNYALNDIGLIYRKLVTNQSNDYSSSVEKLRKGAEKKLAELYEAFNENN